MAATQKTTKSGIVIPEEYNPINATVELGRDPNDLVNLTKFDPTVWQSYVQIRGKNYSNDEMTFLKASFIAIDDEKVQSDILLSINQFYYFQVKHIHKDRSAEKIKALINNQTKDGVVFDVIALRYRSFKTYMIDNSKYIDEAKRGEFKVDGSRAEISIKMAKAQINNIISSNKNFVNNVTLTQNITNITSDAKQITNAINKRIQEAEEGLQTGISGITSEQIKISDLLKNRTQLFTPEQLRDPNIQNLLIQQATSDAQLEIQKEQQLKDLNRQLRREGVFDPLLSTIDNPDVPNMLGATDMIAKQINPGNFSSSKFALPRILPSDINGNSELDKIKASAEKSNLEFASKKRLGRPRNNPRVNAFLEQRSINRIKSFINPEEQPLEFKAVDIKKEGFKTLDPNLGYLPADYAAKNKSFTDIDPKMSRDDKINLLKEMMFKPYG